MSNSNDKKYQAASSSDRNATPSGKNPSKEGTKGTPGGSRPDQQRPDQQRPGAGNPGNPGNPSTGNRPNTNDPFKTK